MSNYIDYMANFSQSDLRGYLGEDMVDLLVEWMPNGDTLLTKQRMVSMINSLYGTSILKNKQFRKDLLQCMKSSDILAIRDACLTGREKNESNVFAVIDCIVNKPWNKNKVTEYLLKLWNVPDTILNKEKDSTVIKSEIAASDEQFYELLDYQYYIKQRVLNNLNSDHLLERMLVHMPTGTGKTKTTMHIITNYIKLYMSF